MPSQQSLNVLQSKLGPGQTAFTYWHAWWQANLDSLGIPAHISHQQPPKEVVVLGWTCESVISRVEEFPRRILNSFSPELLLQAELARGSTAAPGANPNLPRSVTRARCFLRPITRLFWGKREGARRPLIVPHSPKKEEGRTTSTFVREWGTFLSRSVTHWRSVLLHDCVWEEVNSCSVSITCS